MQNELRDIEKLSLVSKEAQDTLKSDLQRQLQGVEQSRHDLMPEHQKVQKRSRKIQNIQDKRRNMQKESAAAQEEMREIREGTDRNVERFRQLSDKVDRNKMADAQMADELHRNQVTAAWRSSGNGLLPWCESNGDPMVKGTKCPRTSGSISGADARKRRRKKE